MIRFFIGALLGVASHQTNHLFKSWERANGRAWVLMARYAFGVLLVVLVQWLLNKNKNRDDVAQLGIVAAVAVGTGVAIGYVLDDLPRVRPMNSP